MRYEASATIDAPAAAVWAVLTDGQTYPEWEENVTRVEGRIGPGEQITVHTRLSDRAFPVVVGDWEEGRRMTWTGGMPLGLFRGVRTFELHPEGEQTRFEVHEQFSGPLLFLMRRMMPDLQPSFDAFAAGLKQRAEAG